MITYNFKHGESGLNKEMKNKCKHLTETQRNELIKIL